MLCLTESTTYVTQHLPAWAIELLASLEIDSVEVDLETLDRIAATIDDGPSQAHLLIGFIAGYAAGLAEGGGMADFDRAHAASVRFMRKHVVGE